MSTEWINRLAELQKRLAACPADIQTRHELASLLEDLGQHEEALDHWNAVLRTDPNNLKAREGVARCRQRSGRPLQSRL